MAESADWYEGTMSWVSEAVSSSDSVLNKWAPVKIVVDQWNASTQWQWGALSDSWQSIGSIFVDGHNKIWHDAWHSDNLLTGAGTLFKGIWDTAVYGVTAGIVGAAAAGIGTVIGIISDSTGEKQSLSGQAVGLVISGFEKWYSTRGANITSYSNIQGTGLMNLMENIGASSDSYILSTIAKGAIVFSDGALRTYTNGVDNTSFGDLMAKSWTSGLLTAILNSSSSSSQYSVHFADSTPLDSGTNSENLYGNMVLGVPPMFTNIADPKNRAISNSFLKDANFMTLVPGFPKYNGSIYLQKTSDDQLHMTTTADSMISYLVNNGLSGAFAKADRRYYTFKQDYEEYYRYLETMLNTVWVKMGLSKETDGSYSLFSFFSKDTNQTLLSQYQHPLSFMVNPAGAATESINSSLTTFGNSLMSQVNDASETYQQINYITGMGTAGGSRTAARTAAISGGVAMNMKNLVADTFSNTVNGFSSGQKWYTKLLKAAVGLVMDTNQFLSQQDSGALIQSFATTNGMKVVYPELWSDSGFSKTISINFEFISPYGDPLSIYHYVMVPFLSLLCYAMPRQAADNGYVSPFFVRADIPGFFTSDLAIMSDFTWTRGGNQGLWTKDGLPRAIAGSFTLADLYPYLAMTKRISFLSANPNYTSFLNSLSGFHAIDKTDDGDALNEYWLNMMNRVTTDESLGGAWNDYSSEQKRAHKMYSGQQKKSRFGNKSASSGATWLRKVK